MRVLHSSQFENIFNCCFVRFVVFAVFEVLKSLKLEKSQNWLTEIDKTDTTQKTDLHYFQNRVEKVQSKKYWTKKTKDNFENSFILHQK